MNDQQYNDQVKFLIKALQQFQKQGFKDKSQLVKLEFDGVLGQDIQDTVFWLITTRDLPSFPQFKEFTKKEFDDLALDDEINALEEIIKLNLYQNVPYLAEMMEELQKRQAVAQEMHARGITQIPIDQSTEARMRRLVNYLEIDQAIDKVLPNTDVDELSTIEAKRANDLRDAILAAKKDQENFKYVLDRIEQQVKTRNSKISDAKAREIAKATTDYITNSQKDQALATVSPQKIEAISATDEPINVLEILNFSNDIENIAKTVVLPIVWASEKEKLVAAATDDPKTFDDSLVEELTTRISGPNEILSEDQQEVVRKVVEEYREKLVSSPSFIPTVIVPERLKDSISNNNIALEAVVEELPVETDGKKPSLDLISKTNFGDETEIFALAVQERLLDIGNNYPEVTVLPEKFELPQSTAQKVQGFITLIANKRTSDVLTDNLLVIETEPQFLKPTTSTLGPLQTAFIPTAVRISLPAAAKVDPVSATAKAFYYLHGYTKSSFRIVAQEAGLSPTQVETFTDYLDTFQTAHPDFAGILASQRAAFNPQQIQIIFTGPSSMYNNYVNQLPPVSLAQGFSLQIGQSIFGGLADRYIDRAIRTGLAKAAKRAGGVVAKKIATSAFGKILQTIGSAVGILGGVVGKAVSVVGGWLLSKAQIGIKTNIGKLFAGAGLVLGFILGGPVGAVVGGILGASSAGIDWKKVGRLIISVTIAILASIFGAIIVPLAIAFIGVPIAIALILFIINSGAYVVPPSGGTLVNNPTTAGLGCPTGWPTHPNPGERVFIITQGPEGITDHAAFHEEAIDIGVNVGHPVLATVSGVAYSLPSVDGYGIHIDLLTNCDGKQVTIRYAHLITTNSSISSSGTPVSAGQELGLTGSTGNSTGPHLHYEFVGGILMAPPYIPAQILPDRVCTNGSSDPCTTTVD